jgi:hypothetical protein
MENENLDDKLTIIGRTNFHSQSKLFGIRLDDRRRHVHVMGKTGMGKTSLLLNMAVSDIRNGHGMAFVDPHGDVAMDLLEYIPENRIKDVVYFNPSDLEYPIAFNVLGDVPVNQRHIVGDGLVGVFKKIWADSWGPRLEYILRNTILTLLAYPGSTLLDIMRILVDKDFRKLVVDTIDDSMLKSFWNNEFNKMNDKILTEAISPIQNKVGQFTSSKLIRNIVGQKQSSIDIRQIMDERKILIMNLSKGAVGEGSAQLLGAMMITKMQLAAMSRVDIPQNERKDFFAYVDEFQNFSTDSFADILSEARKYRLGLILAHQYIEQLSEVVRAAVFGNVGTSILFRVGSADAEFLETEFGPNILPSDMVNLPKWKIYIKLMINGVTSEPFSADTIPDPEKEVVSNAQRVIEFSRQTYGRKKSDVMDVIEQEQFNPKPPEGKHDKDGRTVVWKSDSAPIANNQQVPTRVIPPEVKAQMEELKKSIQPPVEGVNNAKNETVRLEDKLVIPTINSSQNFGMKVEQKIVNSVPPVPVVTSTPPLESKPLVNLTVDNNNKGISSSSKDRARNFQHMNHFVKDHDDTMGTTMPKHHRDVGVTVSRPRFHQPKERKRFEDAHVVEKMRKEIKLGKMSENISSAAQTNDVLARKLKEKLAQKQQELSQVSVAPTLSEVQPVQSVVTKIAPDERVSMVSVAQAILEGFGKKVDLNSTPDTSSQVIPKFGVSTKSEIPANPIPPETKPMEQPNNVIMPGQIIKF